MEEILKDHSLVFGQKGMERGEKLTFRRDWAN
jgi:hypothetical protein